MAEASTSSPKSSQLLAYLQLVRLPAVFTAMSDVLMGYVVTHGGFEPLPPLLGLLVVSSLLYTFGMVFNDVYDHEIDAVERPQRPIPSGRIPLRKAYRFGSRLLGGGVALAAVLSGIVEDWRPLAIALGIAFAAFYYNSRLKHTSLGPLGMGACRTLNVLLGMSVAAQSWHSGHYLIALGIGVYIAGVTWFARSEATTSARTSLAAGLTVMLLGIAALSQFPAWFPAEQLTALLQREPQRWQLLWIMLGVLIGWRCVRAIVEPSPLMVQLAIKQSLLSLILLDAVVAFAFSDVRTACVILLLILPAMFLGRWIYST